MTLLYLVTLLVSLSCMAFIDRRWRLVLWHDARRGTIVLAAGLVLLLAWDAVGIALGIFVHVPSPIMTGIVLAPGMPLEEPVFLLFLCHLTMVLVEGVRRLRSRATTHEQA